MNDCPVHVNEARESGGEGGKHRDGGVNQNERAPDVPEPIRQREENVADQYRVATGATQLKR